MPSPALWALVHVQDWGESTPRSDGFRFASRGGSRAERQLASGALTQRSGPDTPLGVRDEPFARDADPRVHAANIPRSFSIARFSKRLTRCLLTPSSAPISFIPTRSSDMNRWRTIVRSLAVSRAMAARTASAVS